MFIQSVYLKKMSDLEVNNTTTSALAQSVKKAAKKKKSKKLTPKQKALEKLEKNSDDLLNDSAKLNKLIQSVAHWLSKNDILIYKLLNQQCLFSLENKYNQKKSKGGNIDPDDDSDDSDSADLVVNTTSVISYDDFKIGD